MYIKVLDGRYAGQVRDIENGTALDLIKMGRATKAFVHADSARPSANAMPGTEVALGTSVPPAAGVEVILPVEPAATRPRSAARNR